MKVLGRYVLDTLQTFFPWDDDLYTYFKEHGLGSSGLGSKKLPLVYTDNCESTGGIPERKRNNVIHPRYFGSTYEQLKWKDTGRETQPIIPAEKPEIEVAVDESLHAPLVQLNIVPRTNGIDQYHLEYSSMSEFGRIYKNWATFYLPLAGALDLSSKLSTYFDEKIQLEFLEETKQAQREKFRYLSIGVRKYVFSYYGFDYAKRYFEANGVNGPLPSLAYDSADPVSRQLMDPLLKIGIIETKTSEGFEKRKAQVALKLSQPKFSVTKRGVRGRAKGRIVENPDGSNFVVTEASDLATKIGKICSIGEDSARIE
ncbi:MAG TPA: hypothetical protein VEL71_08510 [Candidatus Dormibacteraeota bacterium]|nr:hypothetical protein [Candidatus Dormibacteraeota bacterium]